MDLKRISSSVFLILFLSLGEELLGSSDSSIRNSTRVSCNGTFGDCFFDKDEYGSSEFLRPYSVAGGSRWLLQKEEAISYRALKQKPVCDEPHYGDCIGKSDGKENRPCTDYNRCKRANPN